MESFAQTLLFYKPQRVYYYFYTINLKASWKTTYFDTAVTTLSGARHLYLGQSIWSLCETRAINCNDASDEIWVRYI